MNFTIEVRTSERVTVEAKDYAEAQKLTEDLSKKERLKSAIGKTIEVALLGPTIHVIEHDHHILECEGCCPCCGEHCPEDGGVSCGGPGK